MKYITVMGAECTGTTTLAQALATALRVPWVPEAARVFVEREGRAVRPGDEDALARLHLEQVREAAERAGGVGLVVLDSDLLSTVVYARHYQGHCPDRVVRRAAEHRADFYLLTMPDLPWQPEPLTRGIEGDRRAVHRAMLAALRRRGWPFRAIGGDADSRMQAALVATAAVRVRS